MRKPILIAAVVFFGALILLAGLIYRASPGPASQEILGIGIGNYDSASGIAYLSGRRLDCDRTGGTQAFNSVCTIEVAGKTLEIRARRNPTTDSHQLGGACEAYYDGMQWPCSIGSRHVDVHWFAYVSDPLGLDGDQLDALRRKYFFENVSQEAFMNGLVIVPIAAMLVALLAVAVWFWPRARSKMMYGLLVVSSGMASLAGTFMLAFWLTQGFWD